MGPSATCSPFPTSPGHINAGVTVETSSAADSATEAEEKRDALAAEEDAACSASFSPNPSDVSARATRAVEGLDTPSKYADEEEKKLATPITLGLNAADELYYKSVVATADNDVDFAQVRRVLANPDAVLSDSSCPPSMTNDSCSDSDEAAAGSSSEHRRVYGSRKGPAYETRWAVVGAEEAGLAEEMLTTDIANRIENNTVEVLGHLESQTYVDGSHDDKEADDEHSSDDPEQRRCTPIEARLWKHKQRERRERRAKKVCATVSLRRR